MARAVWAMKEDDIAAPVFGDESDDPKLWLFSLSNSLSQEKFIGVLVTLWAIWWARRKIIHEDEYQSPLSTHAFISRYIAEVASLGKRPAPKNSSRVLQERRRIPWTPPPAGFVKIQVDGAVAKCQNKGAYGAICRDENGHFMGASSMTREGITDSEVLETLACSEALCLAKDLNVQKIQIVTDCLNVTKEILGGLMQGAGAWYDSQRNKIQV